MDGMALPPQRRARGTGNAYKNLLEPEQLQLLSELKALRADRIKLLLGAHNLKRGGSKDDLVQRVSDGLENGEVRLSALLDFLDAEATWGKQHVLLFGAPKKTNDTDRKQWIEKEWVDAHFAEHRLAGLVKARRQLVLPAKMSLASIDWTTERLRVSAVRRRVGTERVEDYDSESTDSEGEPIELRAYRTVVTRGLVVFEWDFHDNVAMLHITQLPAHTKYEHAVEEFATLLRNWLSLAQFPHLKLSSAVAALRVKAMNPASRVRAHVVELEAADGKRMAARTKSAAQRLEGNRHIDGAFAGLSADHGEGHMGNFFFTITENSNATAPSGVDPDLSEAHVLIHAGSKNRINFPTPQSEQVIRNVLQRIREVC